MFQLKEDQTNQSMGLYIHWPFCVSKCPYCDFNSHVRASIDEDRWEKGLLTELDDLGQKTKGRLLETVFFGGGTPSLMPPTIVDSLLQKLPEYWRLDQTIEITLEANPNSIEVNKFKDFKAAGINRVSIGVQSLEEEALKFLGRAHGPEEAIAAIEIAKNTFDRYSFDLIYARPKQTLKEWESELKKALHYAGNHISLYQLTIEPGTAFFNHHSRGDFMLPPEDLQSDFYEVTQDILNNHGLPAYEISNHARPGEECRHNMIYWRYGDFGAIGPGAHGRLRVGENKISLKRLKAPETWLAAVEKKGHGNEEELVLTPNERAVEMSLMGLRLREGINLANFKEEVHGTFESLVKQGRIERLQEEGLLKIEGGFLKTTPKGLLRLNAILEYLLDF